MLLIFFLKHKKKTPPKNNKMKKEQEQSNNISSPSSQNYTNKQHLWTKRNECYYKFLCRDMEIRCMAHSLAAQYFQRMHFILFLIILIATSISTAFAFLSSANKNENTWTLLCLPFLNIITAV